MTSPAAPTRSPGLRLGTIAGAPVYLGRSWFVLAGILVIGAGITLNRLGAISYLVGAAYAVLLLGSVLVHEIAHALAARSRGMQVKEVTADFLGGHTSFVTSSGSPGTSAIVAVAGPLANLLIAAAAWPLQLWLAGQPGLQIAALVLWGLALVNVFLAVFNLLPGMPLDGGQLVMALVWKVTGRAHRGWTVAGYLGQVLAVGVVAWVLVRPLFLDGRIPRLWEVAWVVLLFRSMWQGASAAKLRGVVLRALTGRSAADVATPVTYLLPSTPVGSAATAGTDVLAPDATGQPAFLATAVEISAVAAQRPETPLSGVLSRVDLGAVVEWAPEDPAETLAARLAGLGGRLVVLTTATGRPWAVIDARRFDAAVTAHLATARRG